MPAKSMLQFSGYEVNKLYFEKNSSFAGNGEVQITPIFKKEITESSPTAFDVTLGLSIESTEAEQMPFNLCVDLTGHFQAVFSGEENDSFREQLKNQNTVAILFPFLRSTVASLTLSANVSPIILPIINLAEAFLGENDKASE